MRALYRIFPALIAFPVIALASNNIYSAPQGVTNTELQRYIYMASYPTWCGAAGEAAREMRVKPTTDPVRLHAVMKANIDQCANTSWVQQRPPVWNTAVFSAAAAALLAARHEPPPQSVSDAANARSWSAVIAGFVHQPGPGRPGPGMNMPSMYRTNAGRINHDSVALISAINASASAGGAASAAPAAGAAMPQAGTASAQPAASMKP